MPKVKMIITEKEFGRYEVKFECTGDIWKWFKNHAKKSLAYDILEDVRFNEVHEFMYEAQAKKFAKRYEKLVTVVA